VNDSVILKTLRSVVLFGLAGYLSAAAFVSYSARVEKLYTALPSQYEPGVDPSAAHERWYRANTALTPYADRKWLILIVGFPLAMTLAALLANQAGWLAIGVERLLPGLIPVYIAPLLVLFLSAVSFFVLLIPGLGLAACLLALSLLLITSRRQIWFLLGFLLSAAFCAGLGYRAFEPQIKASVDTAWNVFFIWLEVMWGGIFGWSLAAADRRPLFTQSVGSGIVRN
jgi:hypothetical protein